MKHIFSIISCLLVFLGICQKASVNLSVDTKSLQIGNPITFTVKSNVEGNVEIDFPDEFIQGYGSMSGMEQEMDYNSGSVHTIYYFSQNGTFKENGTYTIYAYVKNKKAIYKSNKVTVKVEKESIANEDDICKKNLRQPIFGIIQRSKTKIYEGEAVVLESKVYSKLNINMLEAYQSFELDGGSEVKEIDKTNNLLLSKENYKGHNLLTFTYGKQVIFPSSVGKFRIKPFEMSLQYNDGGIFSERISFTSNSSSIEVIPLPENAPKDFIGGVGKFDFAYTLDKTSVKQNDVLVLEVKITGVGNIQNINKPNLKLPKGMIIYGDPEVKEDIDYNTNGAEGTVVYTYNLQVLQAGEKKLPNLSISYFDPNLKKYITLSEKGKTIEVLPSKTAQAPISIAKNDVKPANEKLPKEEEKELAQVESFASSKWFWPSVLSPLFLAFVGGVFFFKKRDKTSTDPVSSNSTKSVAIDKTNRKKTLTFMKEQIQEAKNLHELGEIKSAFQRIDLALKSSVFLFLNDENISFSKNEILTILRENKVSENCISTIDSCLLSCEEVRYSFEDCSTLLTTNIKKAETVIAELT
ncbi:MAG: BatD family protein [Bacteroidota bacterium]